MASKKSAVPCVVCNPYEAQPGDYCDVHSKELHRLDHQYETLFRLQRTSRGHDHETFHVFLQGQCDPCGRVLVTESDPGNLLITAILSQSVNLETRIADYDKLGIERTYGDQLEERIRLEIVFSWYGNSRACVDIFTVPDAQPLHWDIAPRSDESDEETPERHTPEGGKHSIH